MATITKTIRELWSETEPKKPVLIMGNSDSINLYPDKHYDRYYTIGCNSRLHSRYIPSLTLMVDSKIPTPAKNSAIATHLKNWKNHDGTVYAYKLGQRLKFQPDIASDKIDYSITTAYMAIYIAFLMGYKTIHFVGIDLCAVNGKDYYNGDVTVGKQRQRFFAMCFNHLSYLINKMARYYKIKFVSLSPHSQLLINGHVTKAKEAANVG